MKIQISKFIYVSILVIVALVSSVSMAQVQEMKPTAKYCAKATGLSKGLAEQIASKLKVSVASVRLLRVEALSNGYCGITVDTAKGPQSCWVGDVYSDGKDYWVGGICF